VLSISIQNLKTTPSVIEIGCGKDKAFSIIAAANGQIVSTIIFNEMAAIDVIGIEKI